MVKGRLHRLEDGTAIVIIDRPDKPHDVCLFFRRDDKGEKVLVKDEHQESEEVHISPDAECICSNRLVKKDVVTPVYLSDEQAERWTEQAERSKVILRRP